MIELKVFEGESTEGTKTSTEANDRKRINPLTFHFFGPKIKNQRKN